MGTIDDPLAALKTHSVERIPKIQDFTPVSRAQLGLLPLTQRTEQDCCAHVAGRLRAAGSAVPTLGNIPNRYRAP